MKIQIEDLAKQELINIYYYNYQFSSNRAIKINKEIQSYIHTLEFFQYNGRCIPEMSDERFRELIYKKSRLFHIQNYVFHI